MVKRIDEKASGGGEERKTSIPDSRFFKELMVQKVGEAEFEKGKKRRLPKEEEEEEREEMQTPTPYTTTYYTPPENAAAEENLPSSPDFWYEVNQPEEKDIRKTPPDKQKKAQKKKPSKKEEASLGMEGLVHPKHMKTETLLPADKTKKKKTISKEDMKTSLLSIPAEKKEVPISAEEKPRLKPGEKEVFPPSKKEKAMAPVQWPAQLPTHVESLSTAITEKAEPYLISHPSLPLLFNQMVGTIILMTSRGVTTTEVVLNSPTYEGSNLFGARIIIEKYSTAPDAFNVRLVGNPRAVAIFDENLETLQAAFNNSKLDFSVNLLRTEYEREKFIFHRKEGVGKDEKEKKDKKR